MADHDDTMRNEVQAVSNFQEYLTRSGRTQACVLPGLGFLRGTSLQCLSRRARGSREKDTTMSVTTAGLAGCRQLAVGQHGKLLTFHGCPYEVPAGCMTKEAKQEVREELQQTASETSVTLLFRRCERHSARRKAERAEQRIPENSIAHRQLNTVQRKWREDVFSEMASFDSASYHQQKAKTTNGEAIQNYMRVILEEHEHITLPGVRRLRDQHA